jgi:hypothetical protein
LAREADEFACSGHDSAAFGGSGDSDAAAAPEIDECLVSEDAQRAQDGVRVYAEYGGEVARGRETPSWFCFTVCDRPADLGGDLLMEVGRFRSVKLAQLHGAMHTSFILPTSLVSKPPAPMPPAPETLVVDPEALIKEARRRQRRRWLGFTIAAIGATGCAAALFFAVAGRRDSPTSNAPASPVAGVQTVHLHLAGFGTPLPTEIDKGPCPQGRTLIAITSTQGSHLGSVHECVLTIAKRDVPNYGLARIVLTAKETYSLPGGTIITRERQTIRFARDQRHTTATFHGDILRGTGRYEHARGQMTGGGRGVDGHADWLVSLRLH